MTFYFLFQRFFYLLLLVLYLVLRQLTSLETRLVALKLSVTFMDRSSANHGHADLRAQSLGILGITKMMDASQHFVESKPEAKALLTPYLASSVGNLATISECWHQLELYQPWANSFKAMLTTSRTEISRKCVDWDVSAHQQREDPRTLSGETKTKRRSGSSERQKMILTHSGLL
jgi:hypothetical protein